MLTSAFNSPHAPSVIAKKFCSLLHRYVLNLLMTAVCLLCRGDNTLGRHDILSEGTLLLAQLQCAVSICFLLLHFILYRTVSLVSVTLADGAEIQ